MTHYYVTFVVTVCREFFGGRNSSPHEVSGETTVDKRCDAWIYKTTVDKRYDAWIYNFTWKHLSLWWFLVLCEKVYHASSPRPPLPPFFSFTIPKWKSNRNKSQKFSEGKQAHLGMEASKTKQTRWEWHHNTFTPSVNLVPFCQLCTPQNSLHALNLFLWVRGYKVLHFAHSTVLHIKDSPYLPCS